MSCGLANFTPVERILFFLTSRPKMPYFRFGAGREWGTFVPVWGKIKYNRNGYTYRKNNCIYNTTNERISVTSLDTPYIYTLLENHSDGLFNSSILPAELTFMNTKAPRADARDMPRRCCRHQRAKSELLSIMNERRAPSSDPQNRESPSRLRCWGPVGRLENRFERELDSRNFRDAPV